MWKSLDSWKFQDSKLNQILYLEIKRQIFFLSSLSTFDQFKIIKAKKNFLEKDLFSEYWGQFENIPVCACYKYLGMWIYQKLSMKLQKDYIKK